MRTSADSTILPQDMIPLGRAEQSTSGLCNSPAPAPSASDAPYRTIARVRLAAVGDILMNKAVKDSAAAADQRERERSQNFDGYGALFAGVAPELSDADVTFANLEAPVMRAEKEAEPFIFNAPPALLAALKAAGIDVVSVANNHIYDHGVAGLESTLEEISKAGLHAVGAGKSRKEAEQPVLLQKNGVSVALLAYTRYFNNPLNARNNSEAPWTNPIDPPQMIAAIQRARRLADFVVVSLHWGVEYAACPQDADMNLAQTLLDAGTDVVLGHHPHVLQPIEVYRTEDGRTGLVTYSLGNFISNQSCMYVHGVTPEKEAETRDGVLLRFTAEKRDYGAGVVRTDLAEVRYIPLWTDNDRVDRRDDLPSTIRPVVVDRALAATREELGILLASPPASGFGPSEAPQLIRLKLRLELLSRRKAAIAERLGRAYLLEQ